MKHRAIVILLTLLLLVPIANAAIIDGPTNFINSHGGIVRYDITPTVSQISIVNNLIRFANLRLGGVSMGNLGFDCITGVNMTITGITHNTVIYTIETALPGAVTSYIYYRRDVGMNQLTRPVNVAGGTYTWAAGTSTTTVTTTGTPITVIVTYGSDIATPVLGGSILIWALMPFLVLAIAIRDFRRGELGVDTLYRIVFAGAMIAFMSYLFGSWGY